MPNPGFLSKLLVFVNNKRFTLKNKWFTHLIIRSFWWGTWAIHSHLSFWVSDLSNLLTSLIKKLQKNIQKNMILVKLFWANHSFFVIERPKMRFAQKNERFAHLSWVTWVNRSQLLICNERPERFDHSHSFVLSGLIEWLTDAHLIWAIWANEPMSDERMNKFPTLN